MMTAKKRIEMESTQQKLDYLGYRAIYGGGKGHGFWINGIGWRSIRQIDSMLKARPHCSLPV